jgi:hypothetical protein
MKRTLAVLTTVLWTAGLTAGVAHAASSPAVQTGSATSIGNTTATLNGKINPGGDTTTYQFQWGLTTAYGQISRSQSAGAGVASVSVKLGVSRLIPGTVYHFRLIAGNGLGQAMGTDHAFKTTGNPPPDVATGQPIQLSPFSATVSGVVNPHGVATTWVVQYGLSNSYGMQTFGGKLPATSAPTIILDQLQGLEPGALFHYRLVAVHQGVPAVYGSDVTFLTYPFPPPVPRVLASTNPHRARNKPFVFTTFAQVIPPRSAPRSAACTGTAVIFYFFGKRRVADTLAPLQPNCTFAAEVGFAHKFRKHKVRLRVLIRFRGNGYLAPSNARPETVFLG